MSRAGVGMAIEKLLTDENLRIRFALDRMETVAELFLRGLDLSPDEIDLFCPDGCCAVVPGRHGERGTTAVRLHALRRNDRPTLRRYDTCRFTLIHVRSGKRLS